MTSTQSSSQRLSPKESTRKMRLRAFVAAQALILFVSRGTVAPWLIAGEQATSPARTPAETGTGPEWERRLRTEAPKAWAGLAEYYHHVRGSYEVTTVFIPENKSRERHRKGGIAINGTLVRQIESPQNQGSKVERVLVTNGVYAFAISRRAGDANARFAIEQLQKLGADPAIDKEINFQAGQTELLVDWPWKISGSTLPEWEKTPHFTVNGVRQVGPTEAPLIRVDFDGMHFGRDTNPTILNGWVTFDPSDHWVIREVLTQWPRGGTRDAVFEYGRRQDGFPILTKKVEKMGTEKDHSLWTLVLDIHHEDVPSAEFRLSHYGIAEPDFGEPTPRWRLWLIVNVCLVCLLSAGWLWSRKHRARAHT